MAQDARPGRVSSPQEKPPQPEPPRSESPSSGRSAGHATEETPTDIAADSSTGPDATADQLVDQALGQLQGLGEVSPAAQSRPGHHLENRPDLASQLLRRQIQGLESLNKRRQQQQQQQQLQQQGKPDGPETHGDASPESDEAASRSDSGIMASDDSDNPLRAANPDRDSPRVTNPAARVTAGERAAIPGADPPDAELVDALPGADKAVLARDEPSPPWQEGRPSLAKETPPTSEPLAEPSPVDPPPTADRVSTYESTPHPDVSSNWQEHVNRAIRDLEMIADSPREDPLDQVRLEAYLRLLYLIADDTDRAVETIDGAPLSEQEFWKHQLHGLALYLDGEGMPVQDRRVAVALRDLHQATSYLAETSALDVHDLAFCSEVRSYGVYTEFPEYAFEPDQEVLLYVEIDNFSSQRTNQGYTTSLQGSYQIFDATGRRVADNTFATEEETCRNRRRDYFIPYRMWIPKKIYPGSYTLQLTIEDTHAQKFGQSSIEFTVKP